MAGRKRLPIVLDENQITRFYAFVRVAPAEDACWLWTGSVNHFGHGHFKVGPRPLKAHRIAWVLTRGAIPDEMEIDHICRVPSCVNPQHLALVSSRENTIRGAGPSARAARRTHCKNGHALIGENVQSVGSERRRCMTCHRARNRAYARKKRASRPPTGKC